MKSKVWTLNKIPVGLPTLRDFTLVEEDIPSCSNEGDVIIEAVCFSVDPYMRYKMRSSKVDEPIIGSQVAKVIESKNKKYPVGTYLVGYPGWRERTHLTQNQLKQDDFLGPYYEIPKTGKHPKSTALGVLGMPGATAYFGVLKVLDPQPGEVLLVNGAAGAVGSIVAQMGKILGCTVIAFAGSPKKVQLLKSYGIDHVFNYKTTGVGEALDKAAPNGVNCYFDNVGGDFTAEAIDHMAHGGRVAVCGSISTYNTEREHKSNKLKRGEVTTETLLWNEIKIEGFICVRWLNQWPKAFIMLKQWMDEGRLKYEESYTKGFSKLPETFLGLFSGDNLGKAVVTA